MYESTKLWKHHHKLSQNRVRTEEVTLPLRLLIVNTFSYRLDIADIKSWLIAAGSKVLVGVMAANG